MEDDGGNTNQEVPDETLTREVPQLVIVLTEMKDVLDAVRHKVEALTLKVKRNRFPTTEGMSYLDAKHLLLLSYCQSIVYYLLRKAKGFSIEGHPVVHSLVEIRLFLEKIRPIDKKLEYQVQKLIKSASNSVPEKTISTSVKEKDEAQDEEDPLKYRPNPDMLVEKETHATKDGVYLPPRFAPTTMNEDKMSKEEKQILRRENELVRQSKQNPYVKDLMDHFEGRPEEVREGLGTESIEVSRYKARREERAKQEENLFTRAPVTKMDKKLEKHMIKSGYGMRNLTDGFYEETKTLGLEKENDNPDSYTSTSKGRNKFKKRKRKH